MAKGRNRKGGNEGQGSLLDAQGTNTTQGTTATPTIPTTRAVTETEAEKKARTMYFCEDGTDPKKLSNTDFIKVYKQAHKDGKDQPFVCAELGRLFFVKQNGREPTDKDTVAVLPDSVFQVRKMRVNDLMAEQGLQDAQGQPAKLPSLARAKRSKINRSAFGQEAAALFGFSKAEGKEDKAEEPAKS